MVELASFSVKLRVTFSSLVDWVELISCLVNSTKSVSVGVEEGGERVEVEGLLELGMVMVELLTISV